MRSKITYLKRQSFFILSCLFFFLTITSCNSDVKNEDPNIRNNNILFNESVEKSYEIFAKARELSKLDRQLKRDEVQEIRLLAGKALESGRGVSTDFMKSLDEDLAAEFRMHLLLSCRLYERLNAIHGDEITETEAWQEFAIWDNYWNSHAKKIKAKMLLPTDYTVRSYGLFAMYGIMLMVSAGLIFLILRSLINLLVVIIDRNEGIFARAFGAVFKIWFMLIWSALLATMLHFYTFRPEVSSWLYLITGLAFSVLPAFYSQQEAEKAQKKKTAEEAPEPNDFYGLYMLISLGAFLLLYYLPEFLNCGLINFAGKLIFPSLF